MLIENNNVNIIIISVVITVNSIASLISVIFDSQCNSYYNMQHVWQTGGICQIAQNDK